MILKFFKAECGDAFQIIYDGNDNMKHNIFIDSGFTKTFRNELSGAINTICQLNEVIDLWIISHIHDDHIGGSLKYISLFQNGEFKDIVQNWFYNAPRKNALNKVEKLKTKILGTPISISQGDKLFEYLIRNGKMPLHEITTDSPIFDFYGLKIIILSPSIKNLNQLQVKYSNEKEQFEKIENEKVSTPISISNDDYSIKLLDFNLENRKVDFSIENRSSISCITEINNKRILWLADSNSNDILQSLVLNGYTPTNKLVCEWVKVSHHGSAINNCDLLYNLIDSQNYLISANGENNYNLPNKECFARILRAKNRNMSKHYKFFFTYDNNTLRRIFKNEDAEIFKSLNFSIYFHNNKGPLEVYV